MSVADVLSLSAEEKAAILSGRFGDLAAISARKERALSHLAPTDPSDIARLKKAAQENERLLGAVRLGLMRARARIQALHGVGDLKTYDATGAARSLAPGAGRLTRTA